MCIKLYSMNAIQDSPGNQKKLAQAAQAWEALLREVLTRRFHGTVALELVIHEGVIQLIRRRIEQIEK